MKLFHNFEVVVTVINIPVINITVGRNVTTTMVRRNFTLITVGRNVRSPDLSLMFTTVVVNIVLLLPTEFLACHYMACSCNDILALAFVCTIL